MNIGIDSDKRNEPIKGKIKNSSHLITFLTFFRQTVPEKAAMIIDFQLLNIKVKKAKYCLLSHFSLLRQL
jgi:hypothetical protein